MNFDEIYEVVEVTDDITHTLPQNLTEDPETTETIESLNHSEDPVEEAIKSLDQTLSKNNKDFNKNLKQIKQNMPHNLTYKYRVENTTKPIDKKESERLLRLTDKNKPETIWNYITVNFRLVVFIILKRFHKVNDEMISDGIKGFYKAVSNFNPKYKYGAFTSYAEDAIFCEVIKGLNFAKTQLSPTNRFHSLKKPGKKNPEISFDSDSTNIHEERCCLRERISEPTDLNSSIIFQIKDDGRMCKKVFNMIKNEKYYLKHKSHIDCFLEVLAENKMRDGKNPESPFRLTANRLGITRQGLSVAIHRLEREIERKLKSNPKLYKELNIFLGTKGRDVYKKIRQTKKNQAQVWMSQHQEERLAQQKEARRRLRIKYYNKKLANSISRPPFFKIPRTEQLS